MQFFSRSGYVLSNKSGSRSNMKLVKVKRLPWLGRTKTFLRQYGDFEFDFGHFQVFFAKGHFLCQRGRTWFRIRQAKSSGSDQDR
jgi:hypothetical protein